MSNAEKKRELLERVKADPFVSASVKKLLSLMVPAVKPAAPKKEKQK